MPLLLLLAAAAWKRKLAGMRREIGYAEKERKTEGSRIKKSSLLATLPWSKPY